MRVLVALVSLAVGSPVVQAGQSKAPPKVKKPVLSAKMEKLLGEQSVVLLAGATKVEVFRVSTEKPKDDDKSVAGYRITSTGNEQDEKFAAELATAVLNEKSYAWNIAKGCEFSPGVAFRVWKGEESVVILICFSCDQIAIVAVDKTGKAGKPVHLESDPGRPALLKLAKAVLPFDDEIQKLTEKT